MYLRTIIISTFVLKIWAERCFTPNKEEAECVSLYDCPVFISALADPKDHTIEFISQSSCGGTASHPKVCCGLSAEFAEYPITKSNLEKLRLLPSPADCGYQHVNACAVAQGDREARILEFPWLAGVLYKSPRDGSAEAHARCSGSLVNDRYVLTAAHCMKYDYVPYGVHLGDYHITNSTCDEAEFDNDCRESLKIIGIEEIVLYPGYDRETRIHDIALLRLNATVTYSDYIQPICLPLPGTKQAKVGDVVMSSGWGRDHLFQVYVNRKKRVYGRVISDLQCAKQLAPHPVEITDDYICTVLVKSTEDMECQGDSGSPVALDVEGQWHQEGVVSFGGRCGSQTPYPEVHTRVARHLNWILENLRE